MTRSLPPPVAALVRPMPADFTIEIEDRVNSVRWSTILMVEGHDPVEVELGYSRAGGNADEGQEQANLRARAWQTMELARLARGDLLNYCLVSRHRQRPSLKAEG